MTKYGDTFFEEEAKNWCSAFSDLSWNGKTSKSWTGSTEVGTVLNQFLGRNLGHAHYPTGGGLDWLKAGPSRERDCLAVWVSEKMLDIFRPSRMVAEYFPQAELESFLLIELEQLDALEEKTPSSEPRQEFLELTEKGYVDRSIWDQGFLEIDENGDEIPLPDDARLVTRWLQGKILLVAKGSIWNGDPTTYDGRHNNMSSAQIQAAIEKSMSE